MKTLKHKLLSGKEIDLPQEALDRVNKLINDLPKIKADMERYDKDFTFRDLYLLNNIRKNYGGGSDIEVEYIEKLMDINPESEQALKLKEEFFLLACMDMNDDYHFKKKEKLKKKYNERDKEIEENKNKIYDPIIDALTNLNPRYEQYKRIALGMGKK